MQDQTFNELREALGAQKGEGFEEKLQNLLRQKAEDPDWEDEERLREEYRQKLIDCPYEVQLKEKRGKKFTFVEKDYQIAKLFDLNDTARNTGSFKNPFGAQVPFIRIEAMMSTLKMV